MIAQAFTGAAVRGSCFAQCVSGIGRSLSFLLAQPLLVVRVLRLSRVRCPPCQHTKPQGMAVLLKRATAFRLSRNAARALATGRVALAQEMPSQGRRSLSRLPANAPQGFWPVELNVISSSGFAPACGLALAPPVRRRRACSTLFPQRTRTATHPRRRNCARRSAP